MVVFSGFTVYHPSFKGRFHKDDDVVEGWAFPVMASGTMLLVVGLIICCSVVGQGSHESELVPKCDRKMGILWMQRQHQVSDQTFEPFVLFRKGTGNGRGTAYPRIISSSRARLTSRARSTINLVTVLGVFISVAGFVLQFQGLRGLNWSSTLAQSTCMVVMTALRAWLRRNLSSVPDQEKLPKHHEVDWLALHIASIRMHLPGGGEKNQDSVDEPEENRYSVDEPKKGEFRMSEWWLQADTRHWVTKPVGESQGAQRILGVRRRLRQLTKWKSPASEAAMAVARSIDVVMNALVPLDGHDHKFTWYLSAVFKGSSGESAGYESQTLEFCINHDGRKWKADEDEIEAALSLWLYHINDPNAGHHKSSEKAMELDLGSDGIKRVVKLTWLSDPEKQTYEVARVLGRYSTTLERDIEWWVGDSVSCKKVSVPSNPGVSSENKKLGGLIGIVEPHSEGMYRNIILTCIKR